MSICDSGRDNGMAEEAYWKSLFDVPLALLRLGMTDYFFSSRFC